MAVDTTTTSAYYLRCEFKFGVTTSVDTEPASYYDAVNFTKMEIKGQTQDVERLVSNMESSYGQVISSQLKPKDVAVLNAEFNTMNSDLLSLLIGASVTQTTQTAAAVTSEAITVSQGIWTPLAHQYISADGPGTEIVVKDATSPTPVTIANSHFEFDLLNGMIKPLDPTGAGAATISYHKSDRVVTAYNAGKATNQYVKLLGTGTEKVSGKRHRLLIHRVNMMPTSVFDPVAGGHLKGSIGGDMITPIAFTSPWTWEHLDLDA